MPDTTKNPKSKLEIALIQARRARIKARAERKAALIHTSCLEGYARKLKMIGEGRNGKIMSAELTLRHEAAANQLALA